MTGTSPSAPMSHPHTRGMSELLSEIVTDAVSPRVADRLQRVLLPHTGGAFPAMPDTLARRAERARLYTILQAAIQASSREATSALTDLDPRAARNSDLMAETSQGATGDLLRTLGLNRYTWAIAAAGGDRDASRRTLTRYFGAAGQWVALQQISTMVLDQDPDVASSISANPHYEVIRRISSTEIRFSWISRIILESAADVVAGDPGTYNRLTWLTRQVVSEYFTYVLSAVSHAGKRLWAPKTPPSPGLGTLLAGMCLPAGALAGRSFHDLVLDNTIETKPLVQDAGVVFPAAPREATRTVERAFFELVRTVQGNDPRGDLYEEVLVRALRKVSPTSLHPLGGQLKIGKVQADRNPQDPGQTDYALTSSPTSTFTVVGEAKSHFLSANSDTVIRAFSSDMEKAVRQLDLRLRRLAAGGALVHNSVPVHMPTGARLRGIATPLHSYATAVLDRDALATVSGDRHDIAVIPLHQLILVLQTMRDASDLRRYLAVRANAIRMRVIVWDEVDLLVNYIQDWDPLRAEFSFDPSSPRVRPALAGRSVDPYVAVTQAQPQPHGREAWRRLLLSECHFVAPRRSQSTT
jgi:hypothetical protein